MNHPFECKQIGKISKGLLSQLKSLALAADYKQVYAWELLQTDFLDADLAEVQQVIHEINTFTTAEGFKTASFSILPGLTYGPEHSDTWITDKTLENCKIHIPVITNPFVGSMWPGYDAQRKAFVTTLQEGGIYIYNNLVKHSVVNLSPEPRYHLLLEFTDVLCAE
jgi:hypothetical protein